jgi:hypothetical protein
VTILTSQRCHEQQLKRLLLQSYKIKSNQFCNFTIIIVKLTMNICIGTLLLDLTCPKSLPKILKLLDGSILRPSYVHHFTKQKLAKQQNRLQQNCQKSLHRIRHMTQLQLDAEAGYHHCGLLPTCDHYDQRIWMP